MVDAFQELKEKTKTPPPLIVSSASSSSSGSGYLYNYPAVSPSAVAQHQAGEAPNPYEEKFHSEFCFMSLVMGIFGLILPLFSTLAIIFGIAGLMQTHRERMKGKWMAVAGISLGFLGILLILAAIIFGIQVLEEYMLKFGSLETLIGALGKK